MPRLALTLVLVLPALVAAGCRQRNDLPATIRCTPGETVEIGCAAGCGLGMCQGDPTLRFCDGTLSASECGHATDTTTFAMIDDTSCGGLCPFGRITCPPSGAVTVVPGTASGSSASCAWAADNLGVLPPGGRGAEIITCTAGAPVRVGCSDACGIGHCASSTARIRICDGVVTTGDCQSGPLGHWVLDVTTASSGSDCDFRCPEAVVTCPSSGMLTVSPSAIGSAADYWCQWEAVEPPHHADDVVSCSPGARLVVGCAAGCNAGACVGRGGIRVCDGGITAAECRTTTTRLGDSFGSSSCDDACPETVVVCPASGALTVVSGASFSSADPAEGFACDWVVRAAGLGE